MPNLNVGYETPYEVYANSRVSVSRGFFSKLLEGVERFLLLVDCRFEEQLFVIKGAVFPDSSAQLHL